MVYDLRFYGEDGDEREYRRGKRRFVAASALDTEGPERTASRYVPPRYPYRVTQNTPRENTIGHMAQGHAHRLRLG